MRAAAGGSAQFPREVAAALVLAAAVLLLYLPARGYGFISLDDAETVYENPLLREPLGWRALWHALTTTYPGNWIPLTYWMLMAESALFGLDAGVYHLTNVVLHAANGALLVVFLSRASGALWPSLLAGALFALHPLRVEAVAWVTGRKEVLSLCFLLMSALAYLHHCRRPSWPRLGAALALFVAALMAKPIAVTFPLLLLALDFWPLGRARDPRGAGKLARRAWRPLAVEKVPLLLPAAGVALLTFVAQRRWGAVAELSELPVADRLMAALFSHYHYLGKMLFPRDLALLGNESLPLPPGPWALPAAAGLLGLTWAAVRVRRGAPFALAGWAWYLVALAPVGGIVPHGIQWVADRFSYVPLIGPAFALSWAAARAAARPRFRLPIVWAAVAVAVALGALSRAQLAHWRNSETLYRRSLQVAPADPMANAQMGQVRLSQGRPEEAIVFFRRSLSPGAVNLQTEAGLGIALALTGRFQEAAPHLRVAAAAPEPEPLAVYNLAVALENLGREDEALRRYRDAVRLMPGDAEAHYHLARLLLQGKRIGEAREHALEALRLQPSSAQAADLLARMAGDADGAAQPAGP